MAATELDVIKLAGDIVKTSSVGSVLKQLALGRKLSPVQRAFTRKHVTAGGYAKGHQGGTLRKLLVGPKGATNTLKARYLQGGIAGKGGLLRGELAPSPELLETLKRVRGGNALPTYAYRPSGSMLPKVSPGDYSSLLGQGSMYGMNLGFGVGLPGYLAYDAATNPAHASGDRAGLAAEALGSGAGYLLGGPLGLVGAMAASQALGGAGKAVGQSLSSGSKGVDPMNYELISGYPNNPQFNLHSVTGSPMITQNDILGQVPVPSFPG
jgi:hypothetical protein